MLSKTSVVTQLLRVGRGCPDCQGQPGSGNAASRPVSQRSPACLMQLLPRNAQRAASVQCALKRDIARNFLGQLQGELLRSTGYRVAGPASQPLLPQAGPSPVLS